MTLEDVERLELTAKMAAEGSRAVALMPSDLNELCRLARKALDAQANTADPA